MRILYFYQYFSTPKGSWGTRVYELAKEWVENGHEVIVVSSIYSKSDLKAKKIFETQIIEGIEVKVINVRIDNKQSILKRIITFIIYMLVSTWYALIIKADVVIASSGPITVAIPGVISKIRSKKVIFEVRDLWPQGAIEMGVLKNRIIIKMAYFLEKLIYNKADHIVALSSGIKDDIFIRYGHTKITSIPNFVNLSLFGKSIDYKLPDCFNKKVAIYFGNIGKVNNSLLLLNCAIELKKRGVDDILLLLVGDGQLRNDIQKEIEKNKLNNILMHHLIPKEKLVNYIRNSMVSLIPLENKKILDTSSPNKLSESLAAGVPVIQTTNGWIKELLNEYNAGFTVSSVDQKDIADKLIYLSNLSEVEVNSYKINAKKLAKEVFSKDVAVEDYLNIFQGLL